ncbi:MAG: acyltransferase [Sphingomonadaceae bacterium]|nr:acyltransferase [Sphingomonadaceae bacterium]
MTSPGRRSRVVELDALRGLAALAVVLFHFSTRFQAVYGHSGPLGWSVPWGQYGVHLFFGISGFVIFMTLERTVRAMDFVVSRFSRLYPGYWAAILLTTAAVQLGGMHDLQISLSDLLVNVTMLQNYLNARPVDGVYWTLAVELSFYVCMFGLWRVGLIRRIEWVLIAWVGLKWAWAYLPLSYTLGQLLVQDTVPLFAIGISAYRIWSGERRWLEAGPMAGLALLTSAALDPRPVFAAALVIAAVFAAFAAGWLGVLRARPLAWLGSVSYALYLLHENIGWTVILRLEQAGAAPNVAVAAALALTGLLAWAVTRFIEQPALQAIRAAWLRRKQAVAIST